jgi:hypothetical protein
LRGVRSGANHSLSLAEENYDRLKQGITLL